MKCKSDSGSQLYLDYPKDLTTGYAKSLYFLCTVVSSAAAFIILASGFDFLFFKDAPQLEISN